MHGIRQPQAGISHSRHHPCHRRLPVASGRPIGGRIDLDPHGLVLVDQTAAATDRLRGSGRRLRVVRCRICVPYGHDETATAALPKTLKALPPSMAGNDLGRSLDRCTRFAGSQDRSASIDPYPRPSPSG